MYYTVHTHHIVSNLLEIEVANYNAIGAKTEEKLVLKHYYVYILDNHDYYNIYTIHSNRAISYLYRDKQNKTT